MSIGFIGMGNMGGMLVTALARSGVVPPDQICISNRGQEKLRSVAARVPGVVIAYSNGELAQRCPYIFLCLRPGETKGVLDEISPYITAQHLLVAITNTIDIPVLEAATHARVAKVIPSLLHAIAEGVSLLMFGSRCTAEDRAWLHKIMSAISRPCIIEESQARVASDLTSCGPAFLSYMFRSLAQAACQYAPDLPAETANLMIRQTATATCRLIEQFGYSFDDVISKVSTPGGVTAEGIKVLDELCTGVWEQVIETTIRKEDEKKRNITL